MGSARALWWSLEQHLIRREELDRLAVARRREDFGHQILAHLLRLRGEHAEWELAQLGCGVVEQQLREDL